MLQYWVWLSDLKMNPNSKLRLLRDMGDPKAIFEADQATLSEFEYLKDTEIRVLLEHDLSKAHKILGICERKSVRILPFSDEAYPMRLKRISNPPILLYYEGTLPPIEDSVSVAIVGTRRPSAYGLLHAKELGYQLGRSGVTVVSGCAAGIDRAAMEGALLSGSPVIGVLGNGTDVIYPKSSAALYCGLRDHGCLISEYPPGTPPNGEHFPVRNRIIVGLSLGAVIAEAPVRSGAMITARLALDEGRDLFAIPGSLDCPSISGNILLLKKGAILVADGRDVVTEYAGIYPDLSDSLFTLPPEERPEESPPIQEPEPEEPEQEEILPEEYSVNVDVSKLKPAAGELGRTIVSNLILQPLTTDELLERLDCSVSGLLTAVTLLEIQGYIKRLPGQRFCLSEKVLNGEANG